MKRIKWSETDRFILERWSQVAELARCFRHTQVKMRRSLRAVRERLEGWARERGYEVGAWEHDGELWICRPAWRKDADTPFAAFCLGGFYPNGYFRVDSKFPYRCVTLEGLDGERRVSVAKAIRQKLGDAASAWRDRTHDRACPLWQDLQECDESARGELGGSTDKLFQFATTQFEALIELGDAVETGLTKSEAV